MEPSDEPVLRVNKTLTALVLVGSSPSALPPDLLIAGPEGPVPLQRDTVKILASILAPTLCPSALSSKFRVSVLLYGLEGVFYIAWLCFLMELIFFFYILHNGSPLDDLSCCCCCRCLFKICIRGLKMSNKWCVWISIDCAYFLNIIMQVVGKGLLLDMLLVDWACMWWNITVMN
jgi:hypothetical protein